MQDELLVHGPWCSGESDYNHNLPLDKFGIDEPLPWALRRESLQMAGSMIPVGQFGSHTITVVADLVWWTSDRVSVR